MRSIALVLLVFSLLAPLPVAAQTFPALTGRVVDTAHYLSAGQKTDLEQRLATFEQQTGHQFVVVTVPDLDAGGGNSYPIEDYTYKLGRAWEIGSAERNDGVVLLAANAERQVRIEVGYGLEPVLTDALSATIIRNEIVPRFRDGDMGGGLIAGAGAIMTQLALPEDEAMARQEQMLASDRSENEGAGFAPILFNIGIFLFFFFVLPRLLGRKGHGPIVWVGGGGSGWRGGGGGGWSGGGGGGGFSGGGGSFGGGGASGGW